MLGTDSEQLKASPESKQSSAPPEYEKWKVPPESENVWNVSLKISEQKFISSDYDLDSELKAVFEPTVDDPWLAGFAKKKKNKFSIGQHRSGCVHSNGWTDMLCLCQKWGRETYHSGRG